MYAANYKVVVMLKGKHQPLMSFYHLNVFLIFCFFNFSYLLNAEITIKKIIFYTPLYVEELLKDVFLMSKKRR